MSRKVSLERIHLRNFRSFQDEVITFANPLLLVGRNGSGKSNFVEALALLSECMSSPLQDVLSHRSTVWNGFASTSFQTPPFEIRVDFKHLEAEQAGHYSFAVGLSRLNELEVLHEQCVISDKGSENEIWFNRTPHDFRTNVPGLSPETDVHALALPIVGGIEKFAPLVRVLRGMRVYAIEPDTIRVPQEPASDVYLRRDGSNLASILVKMDLVDSRTSERLLQLLAPVVTGIIKILPTRIGQNQSSRLGLLFSQQANEREATVLDASSMSDGTLTVLALLVAALQDPAPSLLAIEEPELNIHPGALGVIGDLIEAASERSQVVVTTHSPELLEAKWIKPKNLRIVEWERGATHLFEISAGSVRAIRQHLMGAGELLRANALNAAERIAERSTAKIFDEIEA